MKRFLIAGTFRARCRGQVLAADAPMPGTSRLPPVYGGADRQLTDLYIGVDGGGALCDSNWIDRSNAPRAISSAVGRYSAAPPFSKQLKYSSHLNSRQNSPRRYPIKHRHQRRRVWVRSATLQPMSLGCPLLPAEQLAYGATRALAKRLGVPWLRSNGGISRDWLVRCSRCHPVEMAVATTARTAASPRTQMMQIDARIIVQYSLPRILRSRGQRPCLRFLLTKQFLSTDRLKKPLGPRIPNAPVLSIHVNRCVRATPTRCSMPVRI
jgi:hypothetical protein